MPLITVGALIAGAAKTFSIWGPFVISTLVGIGHAENMNKRSQDWNQEFSIRMQNEAEARQNQLIALQDAKYDMKMAEDRKKMQEERDEARTPYGSGNIRMKG